MLNSLKAKHLKAEQPGVVSICKREKDQSMTLKLKMHENVDLISGWQSEIYYNKQEQEWYIADNGSMNGTSIKLGQD